MRSFILLLFCILCKYTFSSDAWVPAGNGTEASVTRAAHFQPGLLAREFDYTGQRGYWIDGVSILGLPDFGSAATGLANPARRFPSGIGGLYARDPVYERYGLSLNASQGRITQPSYLAPVDTPQTRLIWERYGFEGNSLHLDFRRLLTDSVSLDLGLASHSTQNSAVFRYQDMVHQPYTGSLKRDSSRVPLVGRNLAFSTMHIKPALTWYFPRSTLSLQGSLLSLENDDATRHLFRRDTTTYSQIDFITSPWENDIEASSVGAGWEWRPFSGWIVSANHRFTSQTIATAKAPSTWQGMDTTLTRTGEFLERDTLIIDSVFYPSSWNESYHGQTGEWFLTHQGLLNPGLMLEYEYLYLDEWLATDGLQEHSIYQDRQSSWLQLTDTLARLSGQLQVGAQRNHSPTRGTEWEPAFAGTLSATLPWHFRLHGAWQRDTRFPDVTETHVFRTGRITYPDPDLRPEHRERQEGRLEWVLGSWSYGMGLRGEFADDAIVPLWTTQTRLAPVLEPSTAFRWSNRQHLESRDWFWTAGMNLGNWKLFAEHGRALERSRTWDVPRRYYKGSVIWGNRFVEDRLGVNVRWDIQWFDRRWDYAIDAYGRAVPIELRHYMILNFEARMQIRTFELYTRIDNMNHSLQEPAAGYAPEGISFRYGIRWALDD